jgi:hypothetical protein
MATPATEQQHPPDTLLARLRLHRLFLATVQAVIAVLVILVIVVMLVGLWCAS